MSELSITAPAFVEVAHRIVWATAATVTSAGEPRTRILHPIWEFDGASLTGWIATSPLSPKAADLAHRASMSLTYWDARHDVATADCDTAWELDHDARVAGWERFATGAEPVGYDPSIIPGWTDPDAPAFGILRLTPRYLRVMPGSLMMTGQGELHTWRR